MNALFTMLGGLLALIFFLNIKPAAEVLCRITCGFLLLVCYNAVAYPLLLSPIGVNIISSLIVGVFGLPGGLMLYAAAIFL